MGANTKDAGGPGISRRKFLQGSVAAAAGLTILPGHAAPRARAARPDNRVPPNEKIQLACVGMSGMGGAIARGMGGSDLTEVVAMCDVDLGGRTEGLRETFSDAAVYQDFREMFAEEGGNIDAVTIGTPDHSHFAIAMLAMSMGKHVYMEKPLAQTFRQLSLLMEARERFNVVTQMGNQGHGGGQFMQFKTWTEAGIIRDVTRIDAFLVNPPHWHDGWESGQLPEEEPVPDTLDWELWHADKPETQPFSWRFHPEYWRNWHYFGNGLFGDWGAHIIDTAHRFLELGLPAEVALESPEEPTEYIFPQASRLRLEFPERNGRPPLTLTWSDGPGEQYGPELPPDSGITDLHSAGKIIYGGDDLIFYGGSHGSQLEIFPAERRAEIAGDLPEFGSTSGHHENFLRACKGEEETRSHFGVAGALTQVFTLGVIAQRLGGTLAFDPETQRFPDNDEANALLDGPEPREGWEEFYNLV
jgi:predicted dehydrogenase